MNLKIVVIIIIWNLSLSLVFLLKLVICNFKDMKDFFNIEFYRVFLFGYGNMFGEIMIFEVDGGL